MINFVSSKYKTAMLNQKNIPGLDACILQEVALGCAILDNPGQVLIL